MGRLFQIATQIVVVAGVGLLATAPARAEIWCRRDVNATQGACVFATGSDCFRAVAITGGVCERQSALDDRNRKTEGKPRANPGQVSSSTW